MAQDPMDDTPKGSETAHKDKHPPAAGPHADKALTNPDATPGSGALPPVDGGDEDDMGSTG